MPCCTILPTILCTTCLMQNNGHLQISGKRVVRSIEGAEAVLWQPSAPGRRFCGCTEVTALRRSTNALGGKSRLQCRKTDTKARSCGAGRKKSGNGVFLVDSHSVVSTSRTEIPSAVRMGAIAASVPVATTAARVIPSSSHGTSAPVLFR